MPIRLPLLEPGLMCFRGRSDKHSISLTYRGPPAAKPPNCLLLFTQQPLKALLGIPNQRPVITVQEPQSQDTVTHTWHLNVIAQISPVCQWHIWDKCQPFSSSGFRQWKAPQVKTERADLHKLVCWWNQAAVASLGVTGQYHFLFHDKKIQTILGHEAKAHARDHKLATHRHVSVGPNSLFIFFHSLPTYNVWESSYKNSEFQLLLEKKISHSSTMLYVEQNTW